eukprot:1696561-Amphidinium_carterae.1
MHGSNMHDLRAVVRKCLKLHPRRLMFRDMATRTALEEGDLVHLVRHNLAVAVVPLAAHDESESCEACDDDLASHVPQVEGDEVAGQAPALTLQQMVTQAQELSDQLRATLATLAARVAGEDLHVGGGRKVVKVSRSSLDDTAIQLICNDISGSDMVIPGRFVQHIIAADAKVAKPLLSPPMPTTDCWRLLQRGSSQPPPPCAPGTSVYGHATSSAQPSNPTQFAWANVVERLATLEEWTELFGIKSNLDASLAEHIALRQSGAVDSSLSGRVVALEQSSAQQNNGNLIQRVTAMTDNGGGSTIRGATPGAEAPSGDAADAPCAQHDEPTSLLLSHLVHDGRSPDHGDVRETASVADTTRYPSQLEESAADQSLDGALGPPAHAVADVPLRDTLDAPGKVVQAGSADETVAEQTGRPGLPPDWDVASLSAEL